MLCAFSQSNVVLTTQFLKFPVSLSPIYYYLYSCNSLLYLYKNIFIDLYINVIYDSTTYYYIKIYFYKSIKI